jgi:hypothetical protein
VGTKVATPATSADPAADGGDGPTDGSTWRFDHESPLDEGCQPAALWARRGLLALMAVLVACCLVGLLGVHTGTASAERDGYTMTLRYPTVARAGLDVEWQVTVTHQGGFGKQLTLAVTGDYFDIFETQGFHPQPSEETRDAHTLYLTFTAPPGDTFVVYYDAYIQPASQQGKSARVAVVDHGVPAVWIDYRTRLLP